MLSVDSLLSPRHYEDLVRSMDHALVGLSLDGTIVSWNPAAEHLFGYPACDVVGRSLSFLLPSRVDELELSIETVAAGESVKLEETPCVARDGRSLAVSLIFSPVRCAGGDSVTGVCVTCGVPSDENRDRQTGVLHRLLLASMATMGEEFFEILVEQMALAFDARYAFVARQHPTEPGLMRAIAFWEDGALGEPFEYEVAGTPCERLRGPDVVHFPSGLQAEFPHDAWLVERDIDSYLALPLIDQAGDLPGHLGVLDTKPLHCEQGALDLLRVFADRACVELSRVLAQEAARDSDKRFRTLAEQAPVGIFLADSDGEYRFVNREWSEMAGLSSNQVEGEGWVGALHPEDRERVKTAWNQAVSAGAPLVVETRFHRPRRGVIWVEIRTVPLRDEAGKVSGHLGTVSDVSEHKQMELRRLLSDAIARVLHDVVDLGEAAPELLRRLCGVLGWTCGEYWKADRRTVEAHLVGEWNTPESLLPLSEVARKGVPLEWGLPGLAMRSLEVVWSPELAEDPRFVRGQLASNAGLHSAVAFPVKVGRESQGAIVLLSNEPRLMDPVHTDLLGWVGEHVAQLAERRTLEAQLERAQRMESLGLLAGGVAHDLNNLLMVIFAHTELLKQSLEEPAGDGREDCRVEAIEGAVAAAAELVRDLLAFGRREVLSPAVVDLGRLLEEKGPLVRRLMGESVQVQIEAGRPGARVYVDPGRFDQVLMNLLVNARDAMQSGGRLTLGIDELELTSSEAASLGLAAGAYVSLVVADSGVGIPLERQKHVFDPFFTTKSRADGTGLGLALVYSIVQQSGGAIELRSRPQRGAEFRILLPAVTGMSDAQTRAERPSSRDVDGCETIVVVEDEPAVRLVIGEYLRSRGYRVVEAESASEAAERLAELDGDVLRQGLVLSDVVLPGMSGPQLMESVGEKHPGLAWVFMSGYAAGVLDEHGLPKSTPLLRKPFELDQLAGTLRQVLDRRLDDESLR